MTTRFSYPRPVGSLYTGYDNQKTSDITIPSCGLEDVDVALFELFDKELRFFVTGDDTNPGQVQRKVPVIFAAGEKWSLLKNNKPIRDKVGSLILPLITIMRVDVVQDYANDIIGRGMNQQTGEITIRRKLDQTDRTYQNIINRLYLKNQKNLGLSPADDHLDDQFLTDRNVGELRDDPNVVNGAMLAPNKLNNVYETLTIPSPQFYTSKYEVTFWAQYTQQMNSMLELLMSSFLPQGRCFKLQTQKGYWFVASVEESYNQETNFDDMSMQERIIKYKMDISVPAYVLASNVPGVPLAVRRHISAPSVSFSVPMTGNVQAEGIEYPFLGADDPTLPTQVKGHPKRSDLREDGSGRSGAFRKNDPALDSYPRGRPPTNYLKVGNKYLKGTQVSNFNGETSFRGAMPSDSVTGDFVTTISK